MSFRFITRRSWDRAPLSLHYIQRKTQEIYSWVFYLDITSKYFEVYILIMLLLTLKCKDRQRNGRCFKEIQQGFPIICNKSHF